EDRAELAAGLAVIPADANTAVLRERLFQKRHLIRERLLDAQDVRGGLRQGGPQGVLTPGPVKPLPDRPALLPAVDVPGDDADGGGILLRRQGGPAGTKPRPGDQAEPTRQQDEEQAPRRSPHSAEPCLPPAREPGR